MALQQFEQTAEGPSQHLYDWNLKAELCLRRISESNISSIGNVSMTNNPNHMHQLCELQSTIAELQSRLLIEEYLGDETDTTIILQTGFAHYFVGYYYKICNDYHFSRLNVQNALSIFLKLNGPISSIDSDNPTTTTAPIIRVFRIVGMGYLPDCIEKCYELLSAIECLDGNYDQSQTYANAINTLRNKPSLQNTRSITNYPPPVSTTNPQQSVAAIDDCITNVLPSLTISHSIATSAQPQLTTDFSAFCQSSTSNDIYAPLSLPPFDISHSRLQPVISDRTVEPKIEESDSLSSHSSTITLPPLPLPSILSIDTPSVLSQTSIKGELQPIANSTAPTQQFSSPTKSKPKTEKAPFKCNVCSREYRSKSSLKTHLILHTDRAYACEFCPKKFATEIKYTVHKQRHLGIKPYQCDQCLKRFTDKCNMERHYRVHTGERPFQCAFCPSTFTDATSLTDHRRRKHTKEKPFSCDICGGRYASSSDLKSHKIVHSNDRPHTCHVCGQKFKRRPDCVKHISVFHNQKLKK